jgi:hypothetical protein
MALFVLLVILHYSHSFKLMNRFEQYDCTPLHVQSVVYVHFHCLALSFPPPQPT